MTQPADNTILKADVARYRRLLEVVLDPAVRRALEEMLADAERKLATHR